MKHQPRAVFQSRYGPWAIVAGASAGLGAAFAEQIAEQRLNLLLVARRQELLEPLASRLAAAAGVQVRTLVLDLAGEDAAERVEAAADGLEVGLLVYNAALEGETETAAVLFGYLSANLLATRYLPPRWLDERIEQGLGLLPDHERAAHLDRGATLTRRQMMSLVTSLEQLQAPHGTKTAN